MLVDPLTGVPAGLLIIVTVNWATTPVYESVTYSGSTYPTYMYVYNQLTILNKPLANSLR